MRFRSLRRDINQDANLPGKVGFKKKKKNPPRCQWCIHVPNPRRLPKKPWGCRGFWEKTSLWLIGSDPLSMS